MDFLKDFKVAPWLFDTIIRIEEQPKDRLLIIPIGGVREYGKTTGVIQIMRHLGSKQPADDDGVRKLYWGTLREAYRDFDQVVKSFGEWFNLSHSIEAIKFQKKFGYACKDLRVAPEIYTYERTPDLISILLGEEPKDDGTTTWMNFSGYSYNKPTADGRMRGTNLGCGWVNEMQTLKEKPIITLLGSIGRPDGEIQNPVLLGDFNLPEGSDNGYDFLKRLVALDGHSFQEAEAFGDEIDVYFPKMPPPYFFVPDINGPHEFEGRKGHRKPHPDFLKNAPHLKDLSKYSKFLVGSEDEQRRNIYGKFGRKNHGDLVYPEFDISKHVSEVPVPIYEDKKDLMIMIGLDFGLSPGVLFAYEEYGTINYFKEFVIKDINYLQLLRDYIIPYCETNLQGYYRGNQHEDQIVVIGDPFSGVRRDYGTEMEPIKVLTGQTDIYGQEDGEEFRCYFTKAIGSPCGNSIERRLQAARKMFTRPNGVFFDRENCKITIEALDEEYVMSPTGKPKKDRTSLHHNSMDAKQYVSVYVDSGLPTKYEESKPVLIPSTGRANKKRYG